MDKLFTKVEELASTLKDYVNAKVDELKLHIIEKVAHAVSNILAFFIIILLFIIFLVFIGIGFSILLNEWLHLNWAGYLIVAAFYFLLCILIWANKDRMIQIPIMNALIKQFFNSHE